MQKAETSVIDAETAATKPQLQKLLEISVDKDNKIYVNWPVDKKELCIVGLAEAVKLVATYQAPQIIKPKPSIMDFVKGVKR